MNTLFPAITIVFLSLLVSGCSFTSQGNPHQDTMITAKRKTTLAEAETVTNLLYQQHAQWQGVKYKIGGLSKKGIDCSGFVFTTYREKLGIKLPRTTKLQSRTGNAVRRDELRSGDLVFFKTNIKVRHVGIYIEDGKFLHASTKKGVMISRLNDFYWKDRYWHARRVGI